MGANRLLRFGAVLSTLCLIAGAAEAAPRHRIELPKGRLGEALVALGRQAGVSLGISDPELAGQSVGPVTGYLTVEQALRRLLRGKQVGYAFIDPTTIRLFRKPVSRVGAVAPRHPTPQRFAAASTKNDPPNIWVDIVVTGSKRQVRVGFYPGAVQVVESEALLPSGGLAGTSVLTARLPALTSTHFGPGRNKLFIRGIADSSFSGPTQATVGQYLGETRLNYNAPDPDLRLYDLDRVEVLAGPHGTLYGAGSLGGIVRVLPNAPKLSKVEAAASVAGLYTQHGAPGGDVAGMLNVPLRRNRVGLRTTAYAASEGGYIDDLERSIRNVNHVRISGGRIAVRATVGNDWILDFGLTGQQIRGNDAQHADRGSPRWTRRSLVQQPFKNDYGLADVVIAKKWGSLQFLTTAGIVRQKLLERFDATQNGNAPSAVDQKNDVALLTIESRLSQQKANGSGWVGGITFVKNALTQSRFIGPPSGTIPRGSVDSTLTEGAIFGEGSLQLADGIIATAGGRMSYSSISGESASIPTGGSSSEAMFLPAAALSAKPRPDVLLFLRYQEAYRPGGLAFRSQSVDRFRSDRLRAAEAGLRYGEVGRSRFDASLSLVYTRWSDVQADVVDQVGVPSTMNIGDGRILTADLSAGWRPRPGFSLEAAAVVNDSVVTYRDPSFIGFLRSPLPNVARLNARIGAEYRTSLRSADLHLWSAARYVGESRPGLRRGLIEKQGNWLDITFGARAKAGRHAFSVSLENFLDQAGNRFALGSPYRLNVQRQITPLRPRTLRVGWEIAL